jgi:hypothetical protein
VKGKTMNRKNFVFVNHILAAVMVLSITACGGGSSSDGSGTLSLSVTDAPVLGEDIDEVWVRFTHVIIHSEGGDDTPQPVTDGTNPWIDVNLKDLTQGKTMLLGEFELPAGHYSWIRLVIAQDGVWINETDVPDQSEEVLFGNPTLVDCSSCDESHLKLVKSFTIENGGWQNFTIDFDLQKSLTLQLPQSEKPRPDYAYKLRPTLRILETELASTFIWGSVTDPVDPTGCRVYTYVTPEVGDPALIMDDMCVDDPPAVICGEANNQRPLIATDVEPDTVNNDGTFDYRTSPLYPGYYTVALVCDDDDIDQEGEVLTYLNVQEVDASLDPDGLGVEINFPPAP